MSGTALSAVVANYNHGRYVVEAIEAVAAQSRRPDELLVIDDGSTDDSVALLEAALKRHPFARLLRNPKNVGARASYDRGIREARGEYVFLFAADDRVLPGLLEKSMRLLEANPRAGMSTALARLIDAEGRDLGPYATPVVSETARYIPPAEVLELYRRHGSWIVVYSVIYKRSALLEAGAYGPENTYSADGILNFVIPARHGVCFIPEALAAWRRSEGGEGRKLTADLSAALAYMEQFEKRLRELDALPEDLLVAWKRRHIFLLMHEMSRKGLLGPAEIERLGAVLPQPDAADQVYFKAMRLLPESLRLATKLFLFSREKPADRRRILASKLGLR